MQAWQAGKIHSGDIIISREQRRGRGMREKQWLAESGQNLTLSFPLSFPTQQNTQFFSIISFVSLALHAFIQEIAKHQQVHIKWVNDLILNDYKVGGILIDTYLQKNRISYAIIGIGLNVNQLEFPVLQRATSLSLVTGETYRLPELLARLVGYLRDYAELLFAGEFQKLHKLYNQHLYRRLDWILDKQILGVSAAGLLMTIDRQGQLNYHNFQNHQIDFYPKGK